MKSFIDESASIISTSVLCLIGAAFAGLGLMTLALLALIALAVTPLLLIAHIAGALWHRVIRRDAVLESMTGRLPI